MYCTNCGAHNPDAAKYCQQCGSALPGAAPEFPSPAPAPESAPVSAPPVHYAGFWRRFLAHVIDRLILAVINALLVLLFFLNVLRSIVELCVNSCELNLIAVPATVVSLVMSLVWLAILVQVIYLLYCAGFESSRSQATPGKMALGIIVTDGQYRRITFARALGRNLGKIISGMILMIGFIMAGLTARKQALHDMLADCVVIMRPTAR